MEVPVVPHFQTNETIVWFQDTPINIVLAKDAGGLCLMIHQISLPLNIVSLRISFTPKTWEGLSVRQEAHELLSPAGNMPA